MKLPGGVLQDRDLPWRLEFLVVLCLWLALWGALNTGPWALEPPLDTSTAVFHAVRVLFPLAAALLWMLGVPGRPWVAVRRPTLPESAWLVYGVVGITSGFAAGAGLPTAYWGAAFLATLAATEATLLGPGSLERARYLNLFTWAVTGAVLLVLVVVAGRDLLVFHGSGVSGYGVINRVGDVAGMPMSRASGLGRMAGVVGVVALVGAVGKRPAASGAKALLTSGSRLLWGGVWLACTALVVLLQSRGSLAAYLAGLAVAGVLLWGVRATVLAGIGLGLAVSTLVAAISPGVVEAAVSYVAREGLGQLGELSGRSRLWGRAWDAVWQAPLFGSGFQADQRLVGRNAQSGVLYPLLTAGFVGGTAYLVGLAAAWHRLIQLVRRRATFAWRHHTSLIQAAGVLTLLTVRHFPENTSALFSVDLLLMVPVVAYLGEAARREASGPGGLDADERQR